MIYRCLVGNNALKVPTLRGSEHGYSSDHPAQHQAIRLDTVLMLASKGRRRPRANMGHGPSHINERIQPRSVSAIPACRNNLQAKSFRPFEDRCLVSKGFFISCPRWKPCPGSQILPGHILLSIPTPSSQMEIRMGGSSLPCPSFLLPLI